MKKFSVRCRKCWLDVAVVSGEEAALPDCPKCGKKETYRHAILVGKRKSLLRDKYGEVPVGEDE